MSFSRSLLVRVRAEAATPRFTEPFLLKGQ